MLFAEEKYGSVRKKTDWLCGFVYIIPEITLGNQRPGYAPT
jgi:hypothetical protein